MVEQYLLSSWTDMLQPMLMSPAPHLLLTCSTSEALAPAKNAKPGKAGYLDICHLKGLQARCERSIGTEVPTVLALLAGYFRATSAML